MPTPTEPVRTATAQAVSLNVALAMIIGRILEHYEVQLEMPDLLAAATLVLGLVHGLANEWARGKVTAPVTYAPGETPE